MRGREQLRRHTPVDLGEEPPLAVGDDDPARYTRRGVSLRWLFGAVVTAVTSVALMGGALVAALDGRYIVKAEAAVPTGPLPSPHSRRAMKGDLARERPEEEAVRRTIEVSTRVRRDGQDVIRQRPYALVSVGLVLDNDAIGDVPAFNPRELARREMPAAAATDAIYDMAVDGEITVSVEAFPLESAELAFADDIALEETEIERQLLQEVAPGAPAAVPVEIEAYVDPAARIPKNVRIVPEKGNVSVFVKNTEDAATEDTDSDLVELVQPGDTIEKILRGNGIEQADVAAIETVLQRTGIEDLAPGQVLRITFDIEEDADGVRRRPGRFSIYQDADHVASVAMTDQGDFVAGPSPGPAPEIREEAEPAADDTLPTIYRSLFQTLVDQDLPQPVRDVVLGTFSLDVDFNARVRPGDRLTVLYSAGEDDPEAAAEILYIALTAAGVNHRFYRFKTPDGEVDYYDEEGRTGDKFLLRKPMARGVFRSGFGMRRHPILRRNRMHNGVDYAAPRGTPIYASGDGVVKQAGWKAGYGRWISIRHKNGYETGYAHQSRIAKGIRPGVRVKQGQVIGYVGSTGFSTGPHLHYEVRVNGRPVNPLTIRLRRGRELSGGALSSFESERDRIDDLIAEQRVAVASR